MGLSQHEVFGTLLPSFSDFQELILAGQMIVNLESSIFPASAAGRVILVFGSGAL
jgi:hypothetical protein